MKLSKSIIKKYGITKKAWQVQRSQSGSTGRSSNIKTTRTQVKSMAKKRRSSGRSKSGFGSMTSAPIKTNGMVGDALKGVGAAIAVQKFAPNLNIPYKAPIAGYLVGGIAGAAAAWFVAGQGSATTSGGIVLN